MTNNFESPHVYTFKYTIFHTGDLVDLKICQCSLCAISFRSTGEGDSLRENKVTEYLKRKKQQLWALKKVGHHVFSMRAVFPSPARVKYFIYFIHWCDFPLIIHALFSSCVKADWHKALEWNLAHMLLLSLRLCFKHTQWCSLLILCVLPYMEYTHQNPGE